MPLCMAHALRVERALCAARLLIRSLTSLIKREIRMCRLGMPPTRGQRGLLSTPSLNAKLQRCLSLQAVSRCVAHNLKKPLLLKRWFFVDGTNQVFAIDRNALDVVCVRRSHWKSPWR